MSLTTTNHLFAERRGEAPLDRAARLVAEAPLDLTGLTRSQVFTLECAASKVVYERRDTDGSALDLQEVAADRLAVIDRRDRRRVDLVEAAQARRVERAGAGMKAAA
ncbi:hypothetical protein [Brevundimonas viscosa]|uniref:Uncharacterized protein n=1 Tax=Brevundimonas viscosa TaxID=871741 RepID=A0A1I6PRL6_9CAUL|nr:hypothetical protein [Brevundimonas viscosa]SFS42740.1 hypothetical protein SAMN05192570_1209 [Brevundimonas viscosa]